MKTVLVEGPYFEDLKLDEFLEPAPSATITDGYAAIQHMLIGGRLRLPLDRHLSEMVTGSDNALVDPSLAFGVAVGQTTYGTQHVMGNLFYRGVVLKKPVYIGDTLSTTTKVVALRQNKPKPGRTTSGMAVLEIKVRNQRDEEILHFWRCPMIPCRDNDVVTGHADDLSKISSNLSQESLQQAVPEKWDLGLFHKKIKGEHFDDIEEGTHFKVKARDTITTAPELVRMTLNLAMTHTDADASSHGKRLVYGGHTISMAAAQMVRAIPNVVTHLGWRHCDHVAPVFENDILRSEIVVEKKTPLKSGGGLLDLTIRVFAERGENAPEPGKDIQVLDWGLIVLMA